MGPKVRGRHCMVVHAYYPHDPRVEREVRVLRYSGYETDVICLRSPGEPAYELIDGTRVHRLPVARHRGSGMISQFAEYLAFFALASLKAAVLHRRRRFGVVQVHNVPDFLVFSAILPKLAGARILLDLHDLTPEFYASRTSKGMAARSVRVVRMQERISTAFADHVLTVTELWRQALISRGVAASKVDVVMNVADARIYRSELRVPRDSGHELRLLYHGTITYRYGLDLVLHALARLRGRVPVRLVIHGQGEYLPKIQALAASLAVEDIVSFSTSSLPSTELAALIGGVDIGVVPYRSDVFTDGILPTKLMEYAAIGIPAIVSRTSAVEQYFDASMVRFVRPGSVDDLVAAITDLALDAPLRATLGARIRSFAAQNSFAQQTETYLQVVDRLHDGLDGRTVVVRS
jgi:glycosyltransferase involved in cell wall biosynthesis